MTVKHVQCYSVCPPVDTHYRCHNIVCVHTLTTSVWITDTIKTQQLILCCVFVSQKVQHVELFSFTFTPSVCLTFNLHLWPRAPESNCRCRPDIRQRCRLYIKTGRRRNILTAPWRWPPSVSIYSPRQRQLVLAVSLSLATNELVRIFSLLILQQRLVVF